MKRYILNKERIERLKNDTQVNFYSKEELMLSYLKEMERSELLDIIIEYKDIWKEITNDERVSRCYEIIPNKQYNAYYMYDSELEADNWCRKEIEKDVIDVIREYYNLGVKEHIDPELIAVIFDELTFDDNYNLELSYFETIHKLVEKHEMWWMFKK